MILFFACTCPSFSEMKVIGTEASVARVQSVIGEFAGWSGRKGVCVGTIRIKPSVLIKKGADTFSVDSLFLKEEGEIWLEEGDPELPNSTRHELCHALDQMEGHSSRNPQLFPEVAASALYSDADARRRERFARLCAEGAKDPSLWDAIERRCDSTPPDAATFYLQNNLYPHAPRTPLSEGPPLHWSVQPLPLPPTHRFLSAVSGEKGIWLLVARQDPPVFSKDYGLFLLDPDTGTMKQKNYPLQEGVPELVPGYSPRLWIRTEGVESWNLESMIQEDPIFPAPEAPAAYTEEGLWVPSSSEDDPFLWLQDSEGKVEGLKRGAFWIENERSPIPEGPLQFAVSGKERLLLVPMKNETWPVWFQPAREAWSLPANLCHTSLPSNAILLSWNTHFYALSQDSETLELRLWTAN